MAVYGYVGLYMSVYGYAWVCRAMYGCVGLCMFIYGCVWVCMVRSTFFRSTLSTFCQVFVPVFFQNNMSITHNLIHISNGVLINFHWLSFAVLFLPIFFLQNTT